MNSPTHKRVSRVSSQESYHSAERTFANPVLRRVLRGRRLLFGGAASGLEDEEVDIWALDDSYRMIRTDLDKRLTTRRRQHVDAARTFLPRILQRKELDASSGTVVHQCRGCVVFSDASGFTKLTETLAQKADGAEVLSKCLNKFFTPLIDLIEAYRGDVIKFSGDALSILFEATNDYQLMPAPCGSPDAPRKTPLQLACLRGAACCLEIHKRLHNFDTGEGDVRLTLHIGVGAGAITILQVGGQHGRFEYVIAGTPMEQIAIAEPLAGSGETVLSPQCWKEVAYTAVEGAPLEEGPPGYHRIAALDTSLHTYPTVKQASLECTRLGNSHVQLVEDEELLRLSERFIPRAVLKKVRSGNSSSINEMRSVTIVFGQIGGVDVSTLEGSRVAQQLMLCMQRACYSHEGNLNKFLVDDKGLLFLFVFGLPPLMHVDDPVRAIEACFEMIAGLKEMELCGRFGVTTGRAFCGIVGSDSRREYTVMGDTVNLSARLMAKARENSVLIDETTFLRSQQEVTCQKLEPIMVKGKAQPIQSYEPHPPCVHGLVVPQLGGILNQRSWNLSITELEVQLKMGGGGASSSSAPSTAFKVTIPWRARSRTMGGASPLLQLKRWRELQQVEQMKIGPLGILAVGGSLSLVGHDGSGKEEMTEHLVMEASAAGLLPLFGLMRCRAGERWRAVAELMQNCLRALCGRSAEWSHWAMEDQVEEILRRLVGDNRQLDKVLAFLGFEGFDVPGERAAPEPAAAMPQALLEFGAAELAARLVEEVAKLQGVMVLLRTQRGTDLFDSLEGKGSTFWALADRLSELALERQKEMTTRCGGDALHPILLVTVARESATLRAAQASLASMLPATSLTTSFEYGVPLGASGVPLPLVRELLMGPLTEDAAVELMCHCLGLQTTSGGSLVKRKLREFVSAVSINIPTYIRECLQHLIMEKALEVKNGECSIAVSDLNTVNIAEWVQTSMVGGTISQLENLGPAKNHIMKLATVFEGPFSPIDLAAANRVLFGRLPRILAFYDQSKLLGACQDLVDEGFLKLVPAAAPGQPPPADRAPPSLPRWTISNSLYRKVAGCMLLSSQRLLIKRAVLIERALNVEIPKRLQPGLPGQASGRGSKGALKAGRLDFRGDAAPFSPTYSHDDAQEAFTVLIAACVLGNVHMVLEMLKSRSAHVDVNKATEVGGYVPLHFAASAGEAEIVHLLCEQGAQVDAKSHKSETPLLLAAQRGHLEVVQYLCESHDALALAQQDCFEYWEKALPEIVCEGDIAMPLSPAFPGPPPGEPEAAAAGRRQTLSWLLQRLRADMVRHEGSGSGGNPSEGTASMEDLQSSARNSSARMSHSTASAASQATQPVSSGTSGDRVLRKGSDELPRGLGRGRKDDSRRRVSSSTSPPGERLTSGNIGGHTRKTAERFMPGRAVTSAASALIPAHFRNAALRTRVRNHLRGRTVLVVMLLALCTALYLPDIWVTAGSPSSTGADAILSLVMLLFLTELTLLSVVDSSYPFSFFFFMDCVGTISMIWDISFFLGAPADLEQESVSGNKDLTLFRATRTAKVGARAGRLSRLVKVMRFLPGIRPARRERGESSEKLQQISNLLTNVLSKRVACLTIALVIMMPLFTISAYPESDFSMRVWIESLTRRIEHALDVAGPNCGRCETVVRVFEAAVRDLAGFYRGGEYGPYEICVADPGPLTGCYDLRELSGFSAPARKSFHMLVSAGGVTAKFDYSAPTRAEASIGLALISMVIVLMCGACLMLNYSASEQAVRPLERMLTSIKKSAKAIFTSVAAMAAQEDEDFAEDMDGEVALLERVVRKIATLAELSSKKNPFDDATMTGMRNEELGFLALTAVHTGARNPGAAQEAMTEMQGGLRTEISVTMQWQLEEIGLAYEVLNSWDFNVLDLSEKRQEQVVAWLLMSNPGSCNYTDHNVDLLKLRAFVVSIAKGYLPNPYHGFAHAVDVTHTVFRYMTLMQAELFFTMLEQFALLVAAVGHDVGHIGLNNSFLTEVQHELAIRYNDRSSMENMHCCKLFEILAQPPMNIFASVSSEQYREVRKAIIDVILHTDIIQHVSMVKELELLYEMNSKVFEANTNTKLSEQEVEVLSTAENKKLILKATLHAADTSNPTKPWEAAHAWAYRVLDEYASQGDQEKKLGMPVQMLNDRSKVNRPNSQIGFIEFIVTPFVVAEVKVFPSLLEASLLLESNLFSWERLWLEESNPSEVEREKVKERVQKIASALNNRPTRREPMVSAQQSAKSDRRRRSLASS